MKYVYYIDKVRLDRDGAKTFHLLYKTSKMTKAFDFWLHHLYEKGRYVFDYDAAEVYRISSYTVE